MFKKIFSILIIAALLCTSVCGFELLDTGAKTSLEIQYKYDNANISGIQYSLYKVAEVSEYVDYTPTAEFSKYEVSYDMREDGGRSLAQTLAAYTVTDSLTPLATAATDSSGSVRFSDLSTGLYLAVCPSYTTGGYIYSAEPFLVCLPNYEDEKWVNDVIAVPKISRTGVPSSSGGGGGHTPDHRMDIGVLLVWVNDTEETRPKSVDVSLYKGNDLYTTTPVKSTDSWRHTWYNLPYSGTSNVSMNNGIDLGLNDLTAYSGNYDNTQNLSMGYGVNEINIDNTPYIIRNVDTTDGFRDEWGDLHEYYDYYVVEKKVPEGYTVSLTREDNVFILTHTLKTEPAAETTTEAPAEVTTKPSSENPTVEENQPPVIQEPVISDDDTEATTVDPLTNQYGTGGRNTSGTNGPDRPGRNDTPNVPGLPNGGSIGGSGSRTGASGTLPQTGQLKWPVPIMATSGLLIFLLGFIRHKEQEIKLSENENQ